MQNVLTFRAIRSFLLVGGGEGCLSKTFGDHGKPTTNKFLKKFRIWNARK